jgi:hypothetical protein
MTSKDNRTKAELIADLEAKEQEIEAKEKEVEDAKAKQLDAEKRADRVMQEAEAVIKQGGGASAPSPAVVANVAKAGPSTSPDDNFHFTSKFKQYRVPGAEFHNNRFVTPDEELVEKLKLHAAFGNEFWLEHVPAQTASAA